MKLLERIVCGATSVAVLLHASDDMNHVLCKETSTPSVLVDISLSNASGNATPLSIMKQVFPTVGEENTENEHEVPEDVNKQEENISVADHQNHDTRVNTVASEEEIAARCVSKWEDNCQTNDCKQEMRNNEKIQCDHNNKQEECKDILKTSSENNISTNVENKNQGANANCNATSHHNWNNKCNRKNKMQKSMWGNHRACNLHRNNNHSRMHHRNNGLLFSSPQQNSNNVSTHGLINGNTIIPLANNLMAHMLNSMRNKSGDNAILPLALMVNEMNNVMRSFEGINPLFMDSAINLNELTGTMSQKPIGSDYVVNEISLNGNSDKNDGTNMLLYSAVIDKNGNMSQYNHSAQNQPTAHVQGNYIHRSTHNQNNSKNNNGVNNHNHVNHHNEQNNMSNHNMHHGNNQTNFHHENMHFMHHNNDNMNNMHNQNDNNNMNHHNAINNNEHHHHNDYNNANQHHNDNNNWNINHGNNSWNNMHENNNWNNNHGSNNINNNHGNNNWNNNHENNNWNNNHENNNWNNNHGNNNWNNSHENNNLNNNHENNNLNNNHENNNWNNNHENNNWNNNHENNNWNNNHENNNWNNNHENNNLNNNHENNNWNNNHGNNNSKNSHENNDKSLSMSNIAKSFPKTFSVIKQFLNSNDHHNSEEKQTHHNEFLNSLVNAYKEERTPNTLVEVSS